LVDLSEVFPAHWAFLSVVRYPWVARGATAIYRLGHDPEIMP
jgi:hypothetical protein